MTKEQAIEAMSKGEKVTHAYFTDDEYVYMKHGVIYSEDGVCHGDTFWQIRSASAFQKDWSIYA